MQPLMTPEEYQEILRRIEDAYQTAIANAEVQRHEQRSALETIWSLIGNQPAAAKGQRVKARVVTTNGFHPNSQKSKIATIVRGWDLGWPIDSRKVLKRYGEIYPDEKDQPESSTVSKVFRRMEKDKELVLFKKAGFQEPAQYTKTETAARSA